MRYFYKFYNRNMTLFLNIDSCIIYSKCFVDVVLLNSNKIIIYSRLIPLVLYHRMYIVSWILNETFHNGSWSGKFEKRLLRSIPGVSNRFTYSSRARNTTLYIAVIFLAIYGKTLSGDAVSASGVPLFGARRETVLCYVRKRQEKGVADAPYADTRILLTSRQSIASVPWKCIYTCNERSVLTCVTSACNCPA